MKKLLFVLLFFSSAAYALDPSEPTIGSNIMGSVKDMLKAVEQGRKSSKAMTCEINAARREYWKCDTACSQKDAVEENYARQLFYKDLFYAMLDIASGGNNPFRSNPTLPFLNLMIGKVDNGIPKACFVDHTLWSSCLSRQGLPFSGSMEEALAACMPRYRLYRPCRDRYELEHRPITARPITAADYRTPTRSLIILVKGRFNRDTRALAEEYIIGLFDEYGEKKVKEVAIIHWKAPRKSGGIYQRQYLQADGKSYLLADAKSLGCRGPYAWPCIMTLLKMDKHSDAAEMLLKNYQDEQRSVNPSDLKRREESELRRWVKARERYEVKKAKRLADQEPRRKKAAEMKAAAEKEEAWCKEHYPRK